MAENDWSVIGQWVAVLHSDRWMLVDPHPVDRAKWEEANCLFGGLTKYRKPKSIDHFFHQRVARKILVNPTEFITSYYPSLTYWQLLCRPVSFEEWRNMLLVTPFFRELELNFLDKQQSDIELSCLEHIIRISFPPDRKLQFAARLCSENGVPLDKPKISYTYVETDTDKGNVTVKVSADKNGVLKIFSMDINVTTVYVLICCFRVFNTATIKSNSSKISNLNTESALSGETYTCREMGFPRNLLRFEWGPGNDTTLCGLIPISHKSSEIVSSENAVYIKFRRVKDDYIYDYGIDNADVDGDMISRRFVFFWYESDTITFRVSNPSMGKLMFNVLKKDTIYSSYNASVCSYLINFINNPSCNCIPPSVDDGKLGITKYGRKEKFVFNDCVNGIIKICNSGEVNIRLHNFNNIRVQPRLHLMTSCFHNMMRHVFITYNNTLILIRINLPRRGEYLLSLYSNNSDPDSQCIYNGLISVTSPSLRWAPYPELSLDKSYNIGMIAPKSGIVAARTEVYFSIEILDSLDVAAVSCKGWTHLEKISDEIWEGSVTTGYAGTDIRIMARFEKGSDEFHRLLTYKVRI